jgi:hypothetical protein
MNPLLTLANLGVNVTTGLTQGSRIWRLGAQKWCSPAKAAARSSHKRSGEASKVGPVWTPAFAGEQENFPNAIALGRQMVRKMAGLLAGSLHRFTTSRVFSGSIPAQKTHPFAARQWCPPPGNCRFRAAAGWTGRPERGTLRPNRCNLGYSPSIL